MNQPPGQSIPFDDGSYRQSDEELILLYRESRDNNYVGLLYERYAEVVFGIGLKYLKNRHDAEDMMTVVFEKLLIVLLEKDVDVFRNWLYVMVRNLCVSKLRTFKTEQQREQRYAQYLAALKLPEQVLVKEHLISREIEEAALMNLMRSLPANQRICIQYFYFENKSYKQIAGILGESVGKIRSYIQNGRRNLGIMLSKDN
ncbi:MAG: sigma-70 family RNA polymerase sigma factor [Bacteroidetes bacterium]|nr:sigma-70 family RNA polymerase sigma factor [Bacteroidota bacterium]